MLVSVLVCTYNRGALIKDTLDSLLNQSVLPDEIVVINGGGPNNAQKTLDDYQSPILKIQNVVNKNLATSRNIGMKICHGDVIAQTDDDAIVDKDWILNMRAFHLTHESIGAVGGEVIDFNSKGLSNRVADLMTFVKHNEIKKVRTLPGVNVSYKKEAILKVGPYDENLERGEDVDFNWRLLCEGFELLYVPSITVLHKHRSSFKGIFNQQYMYGRSYYRIRLKWPEMYNPYPVDIKEIFYVNRILNLLFQPLILPVQRIKSHKFSVLNIVIYPLIVLAQVTWTLGYLREFHVENKR